jgi:hypothetical protein
MYIQFLVIDSKALDSHVKGHGFDTIFLSIPSLTSDKVKKLWMLEAVGPI